MITELTYPKTQESDVDDDDIEHLVCACNLHLSFCGLYLDHDDMFWGEIDGTECIECTENACMSCGCTAAVPCVHCVKYPESDIP